MAEWTATVALSLGWWAPGEGGCSVARAGSRLAARVVQSVSSWLERVSWNRRFHSEPTDLRPPHFRCQASEQRTLSRRDREPESCEPSANTSRPSRRTCKPARNRRPRPARPGPEGPPAPSSTPLFPFTSALASPWPSGLMPPPHPSCLAQPRSTGTGRWLMWPWLAGWAVRCWPAGCRRVLAGAGIRLVTTHRLGLDQAGTLPVQSDR